MKFYCTDFKHLSDKTFVQLTEKLQIEYLLEYRKYTCINMQLHNIYYCSIIRVVNNFDKPSGHIIMYHIKW